MCVCMYVCVYIYIYMKALKDAHDNHVRELGDVKGTHLHHSSLPELSLSLSVYVYIYIYICI